MKKKKIILIIGLTILFLGALATVYFWVIKSHNKEYPKGAVFVSENRDLVYVSSEGVKKKISYGLSEDFNVYKDVKTNKEKAKYILYLKNGCLYFYDVKSGQSKIISDEMGKDYSKEDYLITEDDNYIIYKSENDELFSYNTETHSEVKLDKISELIGVGNNYVVYARDKALYARNIVNLNENKITISSSYKDYEKLYSNSIIYLSNDNSKNIYYEYRLDTKEKNKITEGTVELGCLDDKEICYISKADGSMEDSNSVKVVLFYMDGCSHCANALNYIDQLKSETGIDITVVKKEVNDNYVEYQEIAKKLGDNPGGSVPYIIVENEIGIIGNKEEEIRAAILSKAKIKDTSSDTKSNYTYQFEVYKNGKTESLPMEATEYSFYLENNAFTYKDENGKSYLYKDKIIEIKNLVEEKEIFNEYIIGDVLFKEFKIENGIRKTYYGRINDTKVDMNNTFEDGIRCGSIDNMNAYCFKIIDNVYSEIYKFDNNGLKLIANNVSNIYAVEDKLYYQIKEDGIGIFYEYPGNKKMIYDVYGIALIDGNNIMFYRGYDEEEDTADLYLSINGKEKLVSYNIRDIVVCE